MLARRVAAEGATLPVGALLGVFAEGPAAAADVDAFIAGFRPAGGSLAAEEGAAPAPPVPAPAAPPIPDEARISPQARAFAQAHGVDVASVAGSGKDGRISLQDVTQAVRAPAAPVLAGPLPLPPETPVRATPLARRLAAQHGVALEGLAGTGSRGRVGQADVLAAIAAASPAAMPAGPAAPATNTPEILPMSSLRRTVARRLTEAKATIPHFYLRAEASVDALLALREAANIVIGRKASVNDFIVRAAALALKEVPDVNIQVHGDAIHRFPHSDIAVAVATARGLVTPIVRAADTLPVHAIGEAVRALAQRAQDGKLKAEDLEGGTFTVSNLGMFGVDQFDAIINPPQGAILAVGAARRVCVEDGDGVAFETRIAFSLSCDHRAIDGATGATFLKSLKALLEEPARLFGQS